MGHCPPKSRLKILPPRIQGRSDPKDWGDDELMTLAEAAALFWPEGPLTTTSLRTAERDNKLEVAHIAGKLLTTKAAIVRMSACHLREDPEPQHVAAADAAPPRTVKELKMRLSEKNRR